MKMFQEYFLHKILVLVTTLLVLAHTKPSGFINIDCGIPENTITYDAQTRLNYTSDASYIIGGVIQNLPSATDLVSQTLRTFPNETRSCYNISLIQDSKYLVRAAFYYGNYDELNLPPVFDLYLGATKWATVQPDGTSITTEEIIHVPSQSYIFICLVHLGRGNPFISAIEVREVTEDNTYLTPPGVSLVKIYRMDLGSLDSKAVIRYFDDDLDRLWYPYNDTTWNTITTGRTIKYAEVTADYQLPWTVMGTAVSPADPSEPLTISLSHPDCTRDLYVYTHFAELTELAAGENRNLKFEVQGSGTIWTWPTPPYLASFTLDSTRAAIASGTCEFKISSVNTTLPPFCNAFEFYYAVNDTILTDQGDVYAMVSIKTAYNISRNWQGDPCAPKAYAWEGVTCRYNNGTSPVVISINLSSSQLSGQIDPGMSNLKNLQTLDLSYNKLIGSIPKFQSQLTSLKVINLTGNNLTGSVPDILLAKSQDGSLSLNVSGNPGLCLSSPCSATRNKGKVNVVLLLVAIVVVLLVLAVALALLLLWNHKRKKHQQASRATDLESKNRQVTYTDILKITNNFDRVLGRGGFGAVYYGYMEGTPVAVKMLSPSSAQGYKEFKTEVKLLLRVHHRNLTSLVGYCNENSNLGLVYEYMANGDLEYHLSKNNPEVQNLKRRLQIAHEAALGLEYLHTGCKPQIVHRDIKTANILLNDQFQAKLADFSLSRAFPAEGGSHISATGVAGTPGFGVVLLETITGRPVIEKTPDRTHISAWVESMLDNGDIKGILDPRLSGDFDVSSVWKIVELAMACVSHNSTKRPVMTQVVTELNECLAVETTRARQGMSMEPTDSNCDISSKFHIGTSPLLR